MVLLLSLSFVISEKTFKLSEKPKVVTVSSWDGKDSQAESDEIPLSELFGDEL
jgi:hypothetical protein